MARSYPTLVGLDGGHCLAAFCLALLMGILYRKVHSLSTVILFVERIRFQLPAHSQLPSSQLQFVTSFQPPARRRCCGQEGRAQAVRTRCADLPLG